MTTLAAPTLRPYQVEMLDSICAARKAGANRLLCKSPTGSGKTISFSAMLRWPALRSWLDSLGKGRGAEMLIIAHREELLDQAAAKIQQANPGVIVTVEQGARIAHRYSQVVVASIQTLSARNFARLDRLLALHQFRVVVVDEAHHAAASTYRAALVRLGFLPPADVRQDAENNITGAQDNELAAMAAALEGWDRVAPTDRLLVGVTATPNRSDAIGLGCVFQSLAFSYGLREAINDGWLVPLVPWVVETSTSLDHVRTTAGEFNQRDLAETVNTPRRNSLAVKAWHDYAAGVPTLAFTVDVAHAHALALAFTNAGVRARAVSGATPKEERHETLAAFSRGELDVITNCMVLTEGVDLPRVGCILHAKPTKSATLYEQMTGRGLRLFPGKTECLVIDLVDVARRHSLQTAPVLYGLPPTVNAKGKRLNVTADALEALLVKYPGLDVGAGRMVSIEELQVRAETFDVWQVQDLGAFGAGRAMNWIKIGADVFCLKYPWLDGTETLTVSPDLLGHYDLSLTLRPAGGGPARQRTIAAQVATSDAAAGLAEAFVLQNRRSIMKLKAADAPWRERPASQKQIALLRRLRVPLSSGLTMGQASNRIDLAMARRGTR